MDVSLIHDNILFICEGTCVYSCFSCFSMRFTLIPVRDLIRVWRCTFPRELWCSRRLEYFMTIVRQISAEIDFSPKKLEQSKLDTVKSLGHFSSLAKLNLSIVFFRSETIISKIVRIQTKQIPFASVYNEYKMEGFIWAYQQFRWGFKITKRDWTIATRQQSATYPSSRCSSSRYVTSQPKISQCSS